MNTFLSSIILTTGAVSLIGILIKLFPLTRNKHKGNIRKSKLILKKLRSGFTNPQIFTYLRKIDPFVFEELILSAFEDSNYKIQRNTRYTGDGGCDGIVFSQEGTKYLIQAKRYKQHINPHHIDQFIELVSSDASAEGMFIHTGKTGPKAKHKAWRCNLEIISGQQLIDLIKGKYVV